MNAEIDPYPVSELQGRYNIGKQAVYNRLDALYIKPTKQGNRSFITLEQLRSLDALHHHITAGGTMADFQTRRSESPLSPVDTLDTPTGQTQAQDLVPLPRATDAASLVSVVSAIAQAIRPTDPLAHLTHLERAATSGWLLTSSEVQQLIGIKPKVEPGGQSFTRGSFTFTKAGKIGGQTSWRVVKANNK